MSSITFILLTNKTERKKGNLHKPELRGIMKFIDNNLWYNPIPEAGFDSGNTALLYLRRRYKIEAKKNGIILLLCYIIWCLTTDPSTRGNSLGKCILSLPVGTGCRICNGPAFKLWLTLNSLVICCVTFFECRYLNGFSFNACFLFAYF